MTIASFIRGATPTASVYALLMPGTTAHARLSEERAAYELVANTVRDRLLHAKVAMGIPEFSQYFLEAKGGKVNNISIGRVGLSVTVKELLEQFPGMVEGKQARSGFYRFRHNSEHQKRFAELMKDCPPAPDVRDICRKAFVANRGELDTICAYPGYTYLEDGRVLLSLREGWPTWIEEVTAAGGKMLSEAEAYRVKAEIAEAKAAKQTP